MAEWVMRPLAQASTDTGPGAECVHCAGVCRSWCRRCRRAVCEQGPECWELHVGDHGDRTSGMVGWSKRVPL